MIKPLRIKCVQLGLARERGEGLRIGTVRRLPRGVKKKNYAAHDYFDVWFPLLAPSAELLQWINSDERIKDSGHWNTFAARYEREMLQDSERRQGLILLAEMSRKTPISIGCYCENDSRCHRSILIKLIKKAGTKAFQHASK